MTRKITIEPVLNGFICEIGCQKIVFTAIDAMTAELGRYYTNPSAVEKEYLKNKINTTTGTLVDMGVERAVSTEPVRARSLGQTGIDGCCGGAQGQVGPPGIPNAGAEALFQGSLNTAHTSAVRDDPIAF